MRFQLLTHITHILESILRDEIEASPNIRENSIILEAYKCAYFLVLCGEDRTESPAIVITPQMIYHFRTKYYEDEL